MTSPAPLVYEEATVHFGRTRALDSLTLAVDGGRVTGLVGPNGAGKTTSLRAAAGLVPLIAGRALVLGVDPARRPVAARRRIGFLPDRPTLPAHLSVGAVGWTVLAAGRQVVAEVLHDLEIPWDPGLLTAHAAIPAAILTAAAITAVAWRSRVSQPGA